MTLDDFRSADMRGRTVLLRADLDVPMHEGRITDTARVARLASTIDTLLARGARIVVIGHLGRPNGVANPVLSLAPVAVALGNALGRPVVFVSDCVGAIAEATTRSLPENGVALLENLRFHAGEQAGDRAFAMLLSVHGDIYVNDAYVAEFGAPASLGAITRLMPSYAGPQLARETLSGALPGIAGQLYRNTITEDI